MKKIITLVVMGGLSLASLQVLAQSAISIQYGVVQEVSTVSKDAKHAGGAVAGGVFGALISGPRHRPLKIMGSAAAGAAIQGAATSGMLRLYTVSIVNGASIQVSTEQTDIRIGDCVRVEQGQHANIRRASTINCEPPHSPPPAHHVSSSKNCEMAKNELSAAETDAAVDLAIKKVRTLCED